MKFLLVGTSFTPGAQALISKGLPQRAEVILQAEPENPYDALAVRVFVPIESVLPSDDLDEALAGFGTSLDGLGFPFCLGHLGAKAETKAAKRASAEGHQFSLCTEWHRLDEEGRGIGRLIQYSNGTCLVEIESA